MLKEMQEAGGMLGVISCYASNSACEEVDRCNQQHCWRDLKMNQVGQQLGAAPSILAAVSSLNSDRSDNND